jgi:hypothetical protein
MFTAQFWKASAERAVKTLAQTLIAILAVGQTTVLSVDWQQAAAVAATATLLSLLTSIASGSVGNYGPSLVSEAVLPPVVDHAPIDEAA